MSHRFTTAVIAMALSASLAACGGGGTSTVFTQPGGNGQIPPGSLIITPSTLSFSGPGAPAQSFTVSSTVGNVPAPSVNFSGCAPVASIATASTTLPATYQVTPTGNGNCSLVVSLGNASAAVGITVGPTGSSSISGNTNTVALVVGGTPGSVTVNAGSGTFSADATACNGIASVSQTASGNGSATFSVAPIAAGSCQFPIVNGSASFLVAVVVNTQPTGAGGLQLSTSSMDFASQSAPAQQGTLNFSGNVGQVSINEADCIGQTGKPKLAFLTLNNVQPGTPVTLPASFTVTPYGPSSGGAGTCVIRFIPQNGTEADLTVTVH